jgi:hypothetical protein
MVECTRVKGEICPTPEQVRSEVWMALVNGCSGIVYFAHEWKPVFHSRALLLDPEMCAALGKINSEILTLAPVLKSPLSERTIQAIPRTPGLPVVCRVHEREDEIYLFAVGMRPISSEVVFVLGEESSALNGFPGIGLHSRTLIVTVLGEDRTLVMQDGVFTDTFGPYAVHLYRIESVDNTPDASSLRPK